MRKLPYREGTWFGVPLEGGGFGVGIVARTAPRGRIILVYLFGPKRDIVPALAQVEGLKARDAVMAIRTGDQGLVEGAWPVIGHSGAWKRCEWPMPIFVRREGSKAWLVHYADDNPNSRVAEEPALSHVKGVQRDSLFGFVAAEIVLKKVLTDGSNRMQPGDAAVQPDFDMLGRDAPQSFREEVLQQSRALGSDTSLPHRLAMSLYLPTEAAARAAAQKVRRLHFDSEVLPGAMEGTWPCRAKIRIIPDSAPLDGIGACFEQIAFELHGDFDGWEAEVIKR